METISEICAEMRGHGKYGEFVSGYEVARFAGRIDEAVGREVAPLRDEVDRLRGEVVRAWAAVGQEEGRK